MVTAREKIADFIETVRRSADRRIRKWIPRVIKDLLIDLEWRLYQRRNAHLKGGVKRPNSPILVISIPKSGTNLLRTLLLAVPGTYSRNHLPSGLEGKTTYAELLDVGKAKLISRKAGYVYSWHLPYEPSISAWLDEQKIKRIFISRDPRDFVVSFYHFVMHKPAFLEPSPFLPFLRSLGSDSERLMACIEGIKLSMDGKAKFFSRKWLPNVKEFYEQFLAWRKDPNTLCLRFEDFAACENEGRPVTLKRELDKLLAYLDIAQPPLSDSAYSEWMGSGLDPQKSLTFRLGRKGSWRKEFTREHAAAFKKIAGDLLIELGYEQDGNW